MANQPQPYPVTLTVDYPDRKLDRLSSFFRLFWALPIVIVIGFLAGGNIEIGKDPFHWSLVTGSLIFIPLLLMIVFRQKYPKWWFDWNLALIRFGLRFFSYLALLRDEYPSTDEEQAVHFNMVYPDAKNDLERGMPLVKWFLAIPHYFILGVLSIAAYFCIFVAWWSILFTRRYPRSFFNFVVGYYRWWTRVLGYALVLVTDRYPPFDFE